MSRALRLAGWSLCTLLVIGLIHTLVQAAQNTEKPKPKHEIKEVMHGAHLGPEGGKSLRDRVLGGEANAEEKQQLLDFYISLAENEPPRGELEDWHKRTGAIVLAAAKIVVGRDGAEEELKTATVCAACHSKHKPPTE